MARVTYIAHNGQTYLFDVRKGASVMEGAVRNDVPGIIGECGGACACATCHVMVDQAWRNKVGEPGEIERGMLDIVPDLQPNSRLSCQIKMTDALDGLIVHMPASQR